MEKIYFIIPLFLGMIHAAYILLAILYPKKNERKPESDSPRYSVEHIVCFKNESRFIEDKLKNCYEIDYPHIHHTFVNDCSTDNTLELLEKHRGENTTLISNDADLGKNQSQTRSVDQTESDLLLFTDANVFLRKDALDQLIRSFDENVAGMCGNVTTTTDMERQDIVGRYWELEKEIKKFQSMTGSVIGFDGGFYCVRRGNYNLRRKNELSDFETAFLVFEQGGQIKYAEAAIAVERERRRVMDSFWARIRTSNRVFWSYSRILSYIHKLSPEVLCHFIFHKFVRYLFVLSFILCLPFIAMDMFRASPFLVLIFLIPYLGRFVIESVALCIGGVIALTGKEYIIWSDRKA